MTQLDLEDILKEAFECKLYHRYGKCYTKYKDLNIHIISRSCIPLNPNIFYFCFPENSEGKVSTWFNGHTYKVDFTTVVTTICNLQDINSKYFKN